MTRALPHTDRHAPSVLTVEEVVEHTPRVPTIQVVLSDSLLRAADRAVRTLGVNRSALIRDALQEHLRRIGAGEREKRDQGGYERFPDVEFGVWDRVAAWPDD